MTVAGAFDVYVSVNTVTVGGLLDAAGTFDGLVVTVAGTFDAMSLPMN